MPLPMHAATPPTLSSPARPVAAPPGIAVVLGSGRSGTSLLMQVLAALGMRVSDTLIPARPDNPRGFFEDAAIVRIQADLLRALGAWPYHPLPADWQDRPATATAREALAGLLQQRLAADGLWGFKDPRTAAFLPLWQGLFVELGVTPKYILALRQPGPVLRSFMQAYDTPAEVAEAVWLRRTCAALVHTRGACHIVHYDDWFSRPTKVAEDLAGFLGLPPPGAHTLEAIVRPDLNRAGTAPESLHDPKARALYRALSGFRGSGWNVHGLPADVMACCPGA